MTTVLYDSGIQVDSWLGTAVSAVQGILSRASDFTKFLELHVKTRWVDFASFMQKSVVDDPVSFKLDYITGSSS